MQAAAAGSPRQSVAKSYPLATAKRGGKPRRCGLAVWAPVAISC